MSTRIEGTGFSPFSLQEDKGKRQNSQPTTNVTQAIQTQSDDEVIVAAATCIDQTKPLWMQTGECKTTHSEQTGIDNAGTLRFGIESKYAQSVNKNADSKASNNNNNAGGGGGPVLGLIMPPPTFTISAIIRGAAATEQLATGIGESLRGVAMNINEATTDMTQGAGNAIIGGLEFGVATISSPESRQAREDFVDGVEQTGRGLGKWNPSFTDQTTLDNGIILPAIKGTSAVQTLLGAEEIGRGLSQPEVAELQKIFGNSIDYAQVTIKEGSAGLFSAVSKTTSNGYDRAFVAGNTIFIKSRKPDANDPKYQNNQPLYQQDLVDWTGTLAHETTHIWQHQNGGTDYLSEAVYAQTLGKGYDIETAMKNGEPWKKLNPEQQGQLIEEAYTAKYFNSPDQKFVYRGVDCTQYLQDALKQIRAGQGAP